MKKKIVIACEPSTQIQKVIDDLKCAGLPAATEAVVLSVADLIAPPFVPAFEVEAAQIDYEYLKASRMHIQKGIQRAHALAARDAKKIKKAFPSWKVKAEACADSPAWALIKKAEKWKADLIVVGTHEPGPLARLIFGSVAQKVAGEAACSVRIIHGRLEDPKAPVRIVIGVDGSQDCQSAVEEVAARHWKKGSAVHLVSAAEPPAEWSPKIPRASKKETEKKHWLEHVLNTASRKLHHAGLIVTSAVKKGDPKQVLTAEAKSWGADVIFVGARGLRGIERFLIGSVSAAVAVRAHCSVEIVRPKK